MSRKERFPERHAIEFASFAGTPIGVTPPLTDKAGGPLCATPPASLIRCEVA
jgi:hypothetical protein